MNSAILTWTLGCSGKQKKSNYLFTQGSSCPGLTRFAKGCVEAGRFVLQGHLGACGLLTVQIDALFNSFGSCLKKKRRKTRINLI